MQDMVSRYLDDLREDGGLKGVDIANIVEETLNKIPSQPMSSLDEVVEFDGAARQEARSILSAASN